MSNSINNNLIKNNSNQAPVQVFDINLNTGLIESLQASINNLNQQVSPSDFLEEDTIQETEIQSTELELTESTQSTFTATRRISRNQNISNGAERVSKKQNSSTSTSSSSSLRAKRTFTTREDRQLILEEKENKIKIPAIQVPFLERQAVGSETQLSDGSIIQTKLNNDGTITETTSMPNGASIIKTYQDFPLDKKGNPTGFRTTIVDNDYNQTILSTLINDLGGGNFSTVTTDITDPSNPFHVISSALVKNSEATDDEGNFLYNSNNSRADGFNERISYEKLSFDDVEGLRRPQGYKSTYNSRSNSGIAITTITETISYTDENGKRVTVIFDVSDSNNLKEISRSLRDDPFITKKITGSGISAQLEKVKSWGLLDITGDSSSDPSSDLLLISRYLKGFRGTELTQNINLGQNPLSSQSIEENISKLLNRGLLDIVGTKAETNNDDLKILARFMMGARGNVLLDNKTAQDDSIKINTDGTNVLTIAENDPLLEEFQEIFGVNGKKLEFNNSSNQKQNYRLFYVNTTNP